MTRLILFHDPRLPELLFRYRARNWPETLSVQEAQRWEDFCCHRFLDIDDGGRLTLHEYFERITVLRSERAGDSDALRILDALEEWGKLRSDVTSKKQIKDTI